MAFGIANLIIQLDAEDWAFFHHSSHYHVIIIIITFVIIPIVHRPATFRCPQKLRACFVSTFIADRSCSCRFRLVVAMRQLWEVAGALKT